jgi:hypothetical protein
VGMRKVEDKEGNIFLTSTFIFLFPSTFEMKIEANEPSKIIVSLALFQMKTAD